MDVSGRYCLGGALADPVSYACWPAAPLFISAGGLGFDGGRTPPAPGRKTPWCDGPGKVAFVYTWVATVQAL